MQTDRRRVGSAELCSNRHGAHDAGDARRRAEASGAGTVVRRVARTGPNREGPGLAARTRTAMTTVGTAISWKS